VPTNGIDVDCVGRPFKIDGFAARAFAVAPDVLGVSACGSAFGVPDVACGIGVVDKPPTTV